MFKRLLLIVKPPVDNRSVFTEFNWDNCNPQTNGEFFFIMHYAKQWKICFDIGANKGEYTKNILKVSSKCTIYCFEPNPLLRKSFKNKKSCKLYSVAVGEKNGFLDINFNSVDSTQSSIYRENQNTKKVTVPQVTIDDFASKHRITHIDFIKIDTEGHEFSVLKGARKLCHSQSIDMIQFEYGGTYKDAGKTLKQVYQLLQQKYIICHLMSTGLLPCKYLPEIETYRYSNWIAISRKYLLSNNV